MSHETAMEGWHAALENTRDLIVNAPDDRYAKRATAVMTWILAQRPTPAATPEGGME